MCKNSENFIKSPPFKNNFSFSLHSFLFSPKRDLWTVFMVCTLTLEVGGFETEIFPQAVEVATAGVPGRTKH